jgi:hypothetical protein
MIYTCLITLFKDELMTKSTQLAKDMEQCRKEMFELFEGQDLATEPFMANLRKIDEFYWLRALKNKTALEEYQLLVRAIKLVKTGDLTSDEALKSIKDLFFHRKMEVVIADVLKTCELLFWMTTAISSYVFCLGLAIPLMFFNPPLGVALTLGASAVMLAATLKGVECVGQFKSFNALNKEEHIERTAISFFTSAKTIPQPEIDLHEDLPQQSLSCG